MSFVHIYIFLSYIRIFIQAYTCTHKSLLKETMIGERKKRRCWNSIGWECWTLCKWSCAEWNASNPFLHARLPWQTSILSTLMHCRKTSHRNTWATSTSQTGGPLMDLIRKKSKGQGLHFPCCIALQTHSVKLWMLLFFSNLMTWDTFIFTGTNQNRGTSYWHTYCICTVSLRERT